MIQRISLPGRIGLIFLVAFFAVMLTLITATSVPNGLGRAAALPPPERLIALARMFEQPTPASRPQLLDAVSGPGFAVRIEPGAVSAATPALPLSADAAVVDSYLAAMPDRRVAVLPQQPEGWFQPLFASALNAAEFHIGLATGETLIVATQSPFVVSPLGLPIGYRAGLIGIVIALATLIMLNREFRPISQLAAAVDRIEPEGEAASLPPIRGRSPEVKALIGAFERLQGRVATLIRARMALIGGIQHDVRTFATRLRLRADKIADADERARAVADISDMIALLEDAMLASRAGAAELDEEMIELAPLLADEVADRRGAGARIDLTASDEAAAATVLGDRLALRRIAANLIENALKYGDAAHLALGVDAEDLVLTVDDEGPGIPPDRRELLLEPFTRLEASRARDTGGAGLGLAVVRSLVAAHRGAMAIDDAPGGGARLVVRLPIFAP